MEPSHSNGLYARNRTKLAGKLGEKDMALVFSNPRMFRNGDQFHPYRQSSDFYYLTGIEQPGSILLMTPDRAYLFISEPSGAKELWEGHQLDSTGAQSISGIANIQWLNAFESILAREAILHETVYFNLPSRLNHEPPQTKDAWYLKTFTTDYPFHTVKSLKPLLESLRLEKEPEEIENIRQAIRITENAFNRVCRVVQPGTSEKWIEAEITHQFLVEGARSFAFDPIVASGKNATTLHYTANNDQCHEGELLLMDFGAEFQNYAADITRTIPVNGKFSNQQKKYYQAVLEVMDKVLPEIKPGTTIQSLNNQVVEALTQKHLELGLYSRQKLEEAPEIRKQYFPHGVSHFIGLDVHDCGNKDTVLKKGMVISWEPGLYIPHEGIGIRIEDDILVDDSPVNLSEHIPKSPDQIEAMMGDNQNK